MKAAHRPDDSRYIDGHFFVNGQFVPRCCEHMNLSINGHFLFRFFPLRICSSCGECHYLLSPFRFKLLIALVEALETDTLTLSLETEHMTSVQKNWIAVNTGLDFNEGRPDSAVSAWLYRVQAVSRALYYHTIKRFIRRDAAEYEPRTDR